MTPPPIDAAALDLLVDDALDPAARRDLLRRLAAAPDGWRRLALAFLEAQAWRAAVGEFARSAVASPPAAVVGAPPRPRLARILPLARLAWAAGLLVAFGLGRSSGGGPPRGPAVASRAPVAPVVATNETPVPAGSPAPPADRPASGKRPPVADAFRRQLERRGFQVERRPGLVAVAAPNGRKVALPVEEVRVRYVGNRLY